MFEYVKIIDSDLHSEHFTKHGFHMNIAGEELIALRITDHIRKTFLGRKTCPILLNWTQDLTKSNQEGNEEEGKATHSRTSGRKRRQPTTKSDDFYGHQA